MCWYLSSVSKHDQTFSVVLLTLEADKGVPRNEGPKRDPDSLFCDQTHNSSGSQTVTSDVTRRKSGDVFPGVGKGKVISFWFPTYHKLFEGTT